MKKGTEVSVSTDCTCKKVESYRMNALGRYVCGSCDKLLSKNESDKVAIAEANYYGW